MSADYRCPAQHREHMGGDRSAQPLIGWGGRNLVDEAFARRADEKREPKRFEFSDAYDRGDALFRRLPEADAGIKHNLLPRDARTCGDIKRAGKERGDVRHDIDRWVGRLPVVRDDYRHGSLGNDPSKFAIPL